MTVALQSTNPTLADWMKSLAPDGSVLAAANLLAQTNEILEDMVLQQGNLPTGHRMEVVTGLPEAYWRSYNMGLPPSKAVTAQIDEQIGMLGQYSRVDKDIADLNGNTAQYRTNKDRVHIEAMNQGMANGFIYGNPANDSREFMGLSTRYSSLSADNAQNIIDAGGTGSKLTSIWMVVWSPSTVFALFPKGSKAGLEIKDHGEQTVYDENNNPFQAYQRYYSWKTGLAVQDWRYVVRIANIQMDPSKPDFIGNTGGQDLLKLMSHALDRPNNLSMGKPAFYMNRSVFGYLRTQSLDKSNNALSVNDAVTQFGTPTKWLSYQEVPLRKVDAILNTEQQIV